VPFRSSPNNQFLPVRILFSRAETIRNNPSNQEEPSVIDARQGIGVSRPGLQYSSPMMNLLRRALLTSVLLACDALPSKDVPSAPPSPARYLYVWAGTGHDSTRGVDMITVLDANPANKTYGSVIAAQTVGSGGLMPHHTEFVLPANGALFANDYNDDKSFLIDWSDPPRPRSIGRSEPIPGGRKVHSFARLPSGNILATYQFGDGKVPGDPGGLVEFDPSGRFVRTGSSRDAAFPGAKIRTYSLAVVPRIDRVVTTSAPMDNERTANVVQVWRLSDLTLLETLPVPAIAGDSTHMYPFELRALDDGSVLMNTYYCGFFRLTNLEAKRQITRVLTLPQPKNIGCSVPQIAGRFWIMPIAYAHRFATIDISNPAKPKEVASFQTDSTFFPHWIAADPGSDRVVVTEQGDGPPMVLVAHLNKTTGHLSWDKAFRDSASTKPGVSYHREIWPNGVKGMAMPHGALFVP
jgi:hypothetical protein